MQLKSDCQELKANVLCDKKYSSDNAKIQGYQQRMRLLRRLYRMYSPFFTFQDVFSGALFFSL